MIHIELFPVVQRVLNPPFINPHLPKMYSINKEFLPRIHKEDIPDLVSLEIQEYARRPKLAKVPDTEIRTAHVTFKEIESAIAGADPGEIAALMATFYVQNGADEFIRRLLLLGSKYLDKSLGHSISCTAFILLETIERARQDQWPAFALLADYFHKGRFNISPLLQKAPVSEEEIDHHLLRATSGCGIVNLHHTITLYAIERVRRFFSADEHNHLVQSWIAFMGDKQVERISHDSAQARIPEDYSSFYTSFSDLDTGYIVGVLCAMLDSEASRPLIGRYLIKAICDLYQGNYNPHYLTGLGSALWVMDRYPGAHPIVTNALYQYIDYFFNDLRS